MQAVKVTFLFNDRHRVLVNYLFLSEALPDY